MVCIPINDAPVQHRLSHGKHEFATFQNLMSSESDQMNAVLTPSDEAYVRDVLGDNGECPEHPVINDEAVTPVRFRQNKGDRYFQRRDRRRSAIGVCPSFIVAPRVDLITPDSASRISWARPMPCQRLASYPLIIICFPLCEMNHQGRAKR